MPGVSIVVASGGLHKFCIEDPGRYPRKALQWKLQGICANYLLLRYSKKLEHTMIYYSTTRIYNNMLQYTTIYYMGGCPKLGFGPDDNTAPII